MSTATHRQNSRSTGATLAFTLVVASFGGGVTGATLALLDGLSLATPPLLTNIPIAVVILAAGAIGVAYFLPVGILLLAS